MDPPQTAPTTPQETPRPELVGSVLAGRYRIVEKLGEGAMGAVYLGEHVRIGRRDAIKVLRGALLDDAESIARFLRGARNASLVRHPNVCTIYDFSDTADGLQFMAMEFVPGETLKDLLDREGALPAERAVRIAAQVADALEAAHRAGVVHRDLKPANVMVSRGPDGSEAVKVVDFDIAKGSQEGEGAEVTRFGFVVGTPEYMSPEQLTGERLDGRSDVYSLGLVLFRMLAGTLPFRSTAPHELMIERLTEPPLRLDEAAPDLGFPSGLQAALDRALQRKASDRQPSAAELGREMVEAVRAADLPATRIRESVPGEGPAPGEPRVQGPGRWLVPAAAALGAVALAGVAWAAWGGGGGEPPAPPGPATRPPAEVREQPPAQAAAQPPVAVPPAAAAPVAVPAGPPAAEPVRREPAPPGGETRPPAVPDGPARVEEDAPVQPAWWDDVHEQDPAPLLDRLFERVGPGLPPRSLNAIRDSARAVWAMTDATPAQRATAAYIMAEAALQGGDPAQCAAWAQRAVRLEPDNRGHGSLLDRCRSVRE